MDEPGASFDRSFGAEPAFRAAVEAIHSGDVATLVRLLDAQPGLLQKRAVGPKAARVAATTTQAEPTPAPAHYFTNPKLFWFVAFNPVFVDPMPANSVEVARVMIERGVERSDLDYALELVLSSRVARESGQQEALIRALLAAGATATPRSIEVAAAHRELAALRVLLSAGQPMTSAIAAALGDDGALRELLATAQPDDVRTAFGLAVINGNLEAARLSLDAGADVNAFLPVHAHSTALHQAALAGQVTLVELLLERGARKDQRDTLWAATPLDWAVYEARTGARAVLESTSPG
jgi:hypothetical protein